MLALVPGRAVTGDMICIIFGCSVPIVLRKMPRKTRWQDMMPDEEMNLESPAIEEEAPDLENPRRRSRIRPGNSIWAYLRSSEKGMSTCHGCPDAFDCNIKDTFPYACHSCRWSYGDNLQHCYVGDWIIPDEYVLIGPSYVHGMMNGEAFKYKQKVNIEEQDFHLV
jgi:hypothetical protein